MSEITITLPDGSEREYPAGTTAADVASSIGSRLAKAAVAATVDGDEVDLTRPLPDHASVAIVTADSDAGRHVLRHSTAHVMAQAVTQLFPGAKFSIGPAIEHGFYYDFELPGGQTFSDDDLGCHRGPDARDHRRRPAVRALRGVRRRGARRVRRPALQGRDHRARQGGGRRRRRARRRRGRRRRHDQRVPQHARVRRPVQGPARPVDRPPRQLQAAEGRRRLLAGQREGPDAAAHLRHGVGVRRRPQGAPRDARRGREARPPPAGHRPRPAQLPERARRRPRRVAPQGRHRAQADGGLQPRTATSTAATSSCSRRTSPRPGCSRPAATSPGTPRACTRRWRWTTARTT